MTDTTGGMPPAGWYPDPYGAPFERWWDGTGWTEHTTTPAPAAPEPVAHQPVAPEPAAPEPVVYEPVASQPVAYEPVAYEPVSYEPLAYEPLAYEPPVAYEPPPLEEPPAATADPFAGFVSPAEPQPYQPPAFEAPSYQAPSFEAPAYEAPVSQEPVFDASAYEPPSYMPITAFTPPTQGHEPEPAAQTFSGDLFGQPEPAVQPQQYAQPAPAAQTTNPGGGNAASSFDFGFGGGPTRTEAPSNAAVPAPPGEDGLFGSWEPNEYSEPPRNGPANAGLTLGVLSFFLSALTGFPGLVLSVLGIGRSARFDREGDGPVGRGKAIAGLALSVIGSAASAALILYGLQLYNATQDTPADAADEPAANANQTENGGFGLEVGDMGTITLSDSDAAAIQFTVTEITTNFTCTSPDAISPENGQFVAVAMNFTLSDDYLSRMDGGTPLHMNQSDWLGFLGDENGTQIDSTDAGSSCITDAEKFPAEFTPGENLSGVIVLDMAEGIASVSYAPSGVTGIDPGMTRWEWTVPA